MVYQKREIRLPEKARQNNIIEEALITKETSKKTVQMNLMHHKDAMEAHTRACDNTEAIVEAILYQEWLLQEQRRLLEVA